MRKQRRSYPLQPNANAVILQTLFAERYLNYLVPSLKKIMEKMISSEEDDRKHLKTIVKFEVDMALALSANGFEWGHALKHVLLRDVNASQIRHVPFNHNLTFLCLPNASKPKVPKRKLCESRWKEQHEEASENEEISPQLRNLRTLVPGGNQMDMIELLPEVGSYIVCLEVQVNILQRLVESY